MECDSQTTDSAREVASPGGSCLLSGFSDSLSLCRDGLWRRQVLPPPFSCARWIPMALLAPLPSAGLSDSRFSCIGAHREGCGSYCTRARLRRGGQWQPAGRCQRQIDIQQAEKHSNEFGRRIALKPRTLPHLRKGEGSGGGFKSRGSERKAAGESAKCRAKHQNLPDETDLHHT